MLDHRLLPEQPPKPTLQPASPGHSRQEGEEPWERILAMVQKTKLSLFFALKACRLSDLTETFILLEVNKYPYFEELIRKENTIVLEEAVHRVLGRKVSVELRFTGPRRTASAIPFDNPEWAAGFTSGMTYARQLIQILEEGIGPTLPANKLLEGLNGALRVLEKAQTKE